jgi:DNA-binding NarL/FixJ family response regulator
MQSVHAVSGPQAAELLERAREAHLRARREEALEALTDCAEWPAPYNEQGLLLRIDVLAMSDAIAALQELAAHAEAFRTADGRAGYLIASARTYMRARNFDAAQGMLDAAAAAMDGAGEARTYELAYARARLAWNRREYDPQNEDLALALRSKDVALAFNALNLRAWMHAGLEDYRSQMRDLRGCLQMYQQRGYLCGVTNVGITIQSTLGIGWELADWDAERDAEAAFETLEWTPEISMHRFMSLRNMAWFAFLRGDDARAQWLFKDSKESAPSPAWKVIAHVDRAYVARMNLNEAWAAEELFEAHSIARTVEWHATRHEERLALITLAVMFAPVDLGQAQRYVSTYIEMGASGMSAAIEASHDPRHSVASQKYAAGRVQAMLGNTELAVRELQQAYEIFASIEYDFRAALAAEALHEITKDQRWLENARVHAAKYPKSALLKRLSGEPERQDDALEGLSQIQRQIALAFCQGADIMELSRRFSRSSFTIGKQLEAVYAAFGVASRTALRDELHRRGLL